MSEPTTLLTSWGERESEDLGDGFRAIKLHAGNPHDFAIFNAVIDHYNRITGRNRPTAFDEFVGQKVTIVMTGENMLGGGMLVAREGRVEFGSSGAPIILPKGARRKGYRLDARYILDVIPGYSGDTAKQLVGQVLAQFPTLRQLTQERLEQLPASSETLSLCAFGSYRMPDSVATDALVLMSEYDRENDIVDGGVVLLRPEHGISEHGSVYGRMLINGRFGEVVGYEPISFAEGLDLCNVDFDEAYARIVGGAQANEANEILRDASYPLEA